MSKMNKNTVTRGSRSSRTNYPVSQNVKRIMNERGIRQADLARALGWTRQDVWLVLNDRREFHPTTVLQLMDVLGCSANALFRTDLVDKPEGVE